MRNCVQFRNWRTGILNHFPAEDDNLNDPECSVQINVPACASCRRMGPDERRRYFGGHCRSKRKFGSGVRASCTICQVKGNNKCSVKNTPITPNVPTPFESVAHVHTTALQMVEGPPPVLLPEPEAGHGVEEAARRAVGQTALGGRGYGSMRSNEELLVSSDFP